ncbi:MAG: helicase, partial [Deltaproteobacteria bacterium]|nr:helicase [Deltaproteobacteria bacterium]
MAAPAERYLAAPAREAIRQAIGEAEGNEVFFIGRPGESGVVEAVRVAARGTRRAVLALAGQVRHGEVVLHNHPSGELAPSATDMQIASTLADEGVGFLIVDNCATRVYAVVEPFGPGEELQPL